MSVPYAPFESFKGRIVIAPVHFVILGGWLLRKARPTQDHPGALDDEDRVVYHSMNPLELHECGGELCRAILERDADLKADFPHIDLEADHLEYLVEGPVIEQTRVRAYHDPELYSDDDLWRHALFVQHEMTGRYRCFEDGEYAVVDITDDMSTPLAPHEIERRLRAHWTKFRARLQNHGGLISFMHEKHIREPRKVTPQGLVHSSDDVEALAQAIDGEGIKSFTLVYDPSISQARNLWRNKGFWRNKKWSSVASWTLITGNYLEIVDMYPHFEDGLEPLPVVDGEGPAAEGYSLDFQ